MSDKAIYWLLRQRDGTMTGDDWAEFADWLAEDDGNRIAFDEAVAADEPLDGLNDDAIEWHRYFGNPPTPANDNTWLRYIGMFGAVAAVVALVAVFTLRGPQDDPAYATLATAPGEQRTLALTDDIDVRLNGGTRIEYSEDTATVRLLEGEALFAVAGAEPEALRVEVADLVLTDIGTIFGVVLDETRVRVAVSEGAVLVNPDNGAVRVDAGQQAEKRLDAPQIVRRAVEPSAVGSWTEGRLEFSDTPSRQVAAEVERSTGMRVRLDDRFGDTTLTGTLLVDRGEERAASDLAALLGGTARRDGEGWRIE